MKSSRKHHRFVCRIFELNALRRKNGKLSNKQQLEHDRLTRQVKEISEENCSGQAEIVKEIGYEDIIHGIPGIY